MKASPGPVVRKKPAARNHIVGSRRKRRVSALRRRVFLRAEAAVSFLLWWDVIDRLSLSWVWGGVMVPYPFPFP